MSRLQGAGHAARSLCRRYRFLAQADRPAADRFRQIAHREGLQRNAPGIARKDAVAIGVVFGGSVGAVAHPALEPAVRVIAVDIAPRRFGKQPRIGIDARPRRAIRSTRCGRTRSEPARWP